MKTLIAKNILSKWAVPSALALTSDRMKQAMLRLFSLRPLGLSLALTAPPVVAQTGGVIQFSAAKVDVREEQPEARLSVVRTGDLGQIVSVAFATTNATATAGMDYTAADGILTFAAGETNQTLAVAILNDGLVEAVETFAVTLSDPTGGAILGDRPITTVRIRDNDRGTQLELAAYSVNEDAGEVRIRVVRGDDGDFPRLFDYRTSNLTARAGQDYIEVSGTLTFASGEVLKEFVVPLVNDAVAEPNQTFRVTLTNPATGGVLGPVTSATVTIVDTDEVVQFEKVRYEVREDAAFVPITVLRGENTLAATVEFFTTDLSAADGLDYTGVTNTLQFGAGERVKRVNIPILADATRETQESFRVSLANPAGGVKLGSPRVATVVIHDNDPGAGFEQNNYVVWDNSGEAKINVLRGNDELLGPFAVSYTTTDGTARAGVDYEAISGALEFQANEMLRPLVIRLVSDPAANCARTFTLTLNNPTGGMILGTAATRITINDAAPAGLFPVAPTIPAHPGIGREGDATVLTWGGGVSVLRAGDLGGPWEALAGVQSPYAMRPVLPVGFYQFRSDRPTELFVPTSYDSRTQLPLILVLHGFGGDAASMQAYFRLRPLAESRRLLLCYPEGTLNSNGQRFWNATDACCDLYGNGEDDSAYLRGVIEDILSRFAVDRKRIYVIGASNGGFMSHRMACDHADLIAGIASLAGVTFLDPTSCRPSEAVHVLQIHGTADEVIPYWGGALVRAHSPGAVKTVQTWASLNGCQGAEVEATPSLDLDLAVPGLDTTIMRYRNCPPGGSVELWTIDRGGHGPTLPAQFLENLVDWLLAHPKP